MTGLDEHRRRERPSLGGIERAWGRRPPPRKGPKPGLTLQGIVTAAVGLAQTDGLGAVSMSRVAAALDVSTMALLQLSRHQRRTTRTHGRLRGGSPPELAADNGSLENLSLWASTLFDGYRRHPWAAQIPISGVPPTPTQIALARNRLALPGHHQTDRPATHLHRAATRQLRPKRSQPRPRSLQHPATGAQAAPNPPAPTARCSASSSTPNASPKSCHRSHRSLRGPSRYRRGVHLRNRAHPRWHRPPHTTPPTRAVTAKRGRKSCQRPCKTIASKPFPWLNPISTWTLPSRRMVSIRCPRLRATPCKRLMARETLSSAPA